MENDKYYHINLEKLNNWYESIKDVPRLSIKDIKALYQTMDNEESETKKDEIRNTIIMGTLYSVYRVIKNNKLYLINGEEFDIEDMIEESIQLLIEKIDDRSIINYQHISHIYRSCCFYLNLSKNLTGQPTFSGIQTIYNGKLGMILKDFAKEKEKNIDVNYKDFTNLLQKNYKEEYERLLEENENEPYNIIADLYKRLDYICKTVDTHQIISTSSNKLDYLIYLAFANTKNSERYDMSQIIIENMDTNIEERVYKEELIKLIFSDEVKLPEIKKDVLIRYFGLEENEKNFREISELYNKPLTNILYYMRSAVDKVRKNTAVKKYVKKDL